MTFHPPPPTFASRRRKPAAGLASHTAQRDAGAVPTATVTPLPDVCFGATVTDVDLGALDDIGFAAKLAGAVLTRSSEGSEGTGSADAAAGKRPHGAQCDVFAWYQRFLSVVRLVAQFG